MGLLVHQAASYRAMEPEVRAANIKELARQLDVLETYVEGPFVLGNDISCADIAILPTLVSSSCMSFEHSQLKPDFHCQMILRATGHFPCTGK